MYDGNSQYMKTLGFQHFLTYTEIFIAFLSSFTFWALGGCLTLQDGVNSPVSKFPQIVYIHI